MLVGYARVATLNQHLKLQRDALTKAGCERLFEEKKSDKAGTACRPAKHLIALANLHVELLRTPMGRPMAADMIGKYLRLQQRG